jgi:hypothetical protein
MNELPRHHISNGCQIISCASTSNKQVERVTLREQSRGGSNSSHKKCTNNTIGIFWLQRRAKPNSARRTQFVADAALFAATQTLHFLLLLWAAVAREGWSGVVVVVFNIIIIIIFICGWFSAAVVVAVVVDASDGELFSSNVVIAITSDGGRKIRVIFVVNVFGGGGSGGPWIGFSLSLSFSRRVRCLSRAVAFPASVLSTPSFLLPYHLHRSVSCWSSRTVHQSSYRCTFHSQAPQLLRVVGVAYYLQANNQPTTLDTMG